MSNYRAGYVGQIPTQNTTKSGGVWDLYDQKQQKQANIWPNVSNGLTETIISIAGVGNSQLTFASSQNFSNYANGYFVKAGTATTARSAPKLTVTANSNTVYTGTVANNNTALQNGTFYMSYTNPGDYWDFSYSGVTAGQTLRINPSDPSRVTLTGNLGGTFATKITFTATSGTFRVANSGSVACEIESAVHYWSTSGEIYSVDSANKKIILKTEWTGSTKSWPNDGETIIPNTVSDFAVGDRLYQWTMTSTYSGTNYDIG